VFHIPLPGLIAHTPVVHIAMLQFGVRNPVVQGMFFDDIAGLGTELPGLLEDLKWSAAEVRHDVT
jgi:hypothetical protein